MSTAPPLSRGVQAALDVRAGPLAHCALPTYVNAIMSAKPAIPASIWLALALSVLWAVCDLIYAYFAVDPMLTAIADQSSTSALTAGWLRSDAVRAGFVGIGIAKLIGLEAVAVLFTLRGAAWARLIWFVDALSALPCIPTYIRLWEQVPWLGLYLGIAAIAGAAGACAFRPGAKQWFEAMAQWRRAQRPA